MPKPPYKGFTALNKRRIQLINKSFSQYPDGTWFSFDLSEREAAELKMLEACVGAMMHYGYPLKMNERLVKESIESQLREIQRLKEENNRLRRGMTA